MNMPALLPDAELTEGRTEADSHLSFRERLWRVLWLLLARWTPLGFNRWRVFLLRCLGARVDVSSFVHPSVRIVRPWNLQIGAESVLHHCVVLECIAPIRLGTAVRISQYTHLCAATRDHRLCPPPLVPSPITVGDHVWLAADVFVGPGVTIGDRAVVGARSGVFVDLPPDMVAVGDAAAPTHPSANDTSATASASHA